jgi:transcriptional regulator with XRE-family HTH domain
LGASIVSVTESAREIFARNLRHERKRLELSQEALGFLCNLNMSEVSRLERSTRDPRLATIVKLANALGIPPAKLLDGIP